MMVSASSRRAAVGHDEIRARSNCTPRLGHRLHDAGSEIGISYSSTPSVRMSRKGGWYFLTVSTTSIQRQNRHGFGAQMFGAK
jgi:hypothetical protein